MLSQRTATIRYCTGRAGWCRKSQLNWLQLRKSGAGLKIALAISHLRFTDDFVDCGLRIYRTVVEFFFVAKKAF